MKSGMLCLYGLKFPIIPELLSIINYLSINPKFLSIINYLSIIPKFTSGHFNFLTEDEYQGYIIS